MEKNELPTGQIIDVIDDLGRMKVFRIAFSGGEPLLRPDLPEIISYTARKCEGRIFLSTNGTLITEDFLRLLRPVRRRLTLKMSMDGPEEIHDGIRGYPGAHKAVAAALALCRAELLTVELTATLMRKNIDFLPEIFSQALAMPCQKMNLVELIPVGRAGRADCLSPEERRRVIGVIRKYHRRFVESGRVLAWRLPFAKGGYNLICGGGISECGILSDGSVAGCRLLPAYTAGNIKERPFHEIWKSGDFGFFRREMPYHQGEACSTCFRRTKCRGGCRAYALGAAGRIDARDPRCHPWIPSA